MSVSLDSDLLNLVSSKGSDRLKELAYLGVSLLQSEHDSLVEKISSISSSLDIEESKVYEIAQGINQYRYYYHCITIYLITIIIGIATLFWECSKASMKNSNLIREALTNANLSNELVEAFSQVYKEHRRTFVELKNVLSISHRKYNNLTWRLDVELARRSMHVMTEPKYMIRLDIEETGNIMILFITISILIFLIIQI